MKPSEISKLKEIAFKQFVERRYDEAIQSFSKLLLFCPQDPFLYFNRATVEYEKAHYECSLENEKNKYLLLALSDAIQVVNLYIKHQIQSGLILAGMLIARLAQDLSLDDSLFNQHQLYQYIESRKYNQLENQLALLTQLLHKNLN